jgi:hypothetical protein
MKCPVLVPVRDARKQSETDNQTTANGPRERRDEQARGTVKRQATVRCALVCSRSLCVCLTVLWSCPLHQQPQQQRRLPRSLLHHGPFHGAHQGARRVPAGTTDGHGIASVIGRSRSAATRLLWGKQRRRRRQRRCKSLLGRSPAQGQEGRRRDVLSPVRTHAHQPVRGHLLRHVARVETQERIPVRLNNHFALPFLPLLQSSIIVFD